jgi:hypothetical protein
MINFNISPNLFYGFYFNFVVQSSDFAKESETENEHKRLGMDTENQEQEKAMNEPIQLKTDENGDHFHQKILRHHHLST